VPSLVEQLQIEAINAEIPVSQLLRRVKLAAVKLKLGSVAEWVDQELNGYDGDVPEYRWVVGSPNAHNPFRGWIPISTDVNSMALISRLPVQQSVSSLEALLEGEGSIFFQYGPQLVEWINSGTDFGGFPRMGLRVDRSTISGMIDRVRGQVLDWAIELEQAGIMGSGVSFSPQEQEKASKVAISIGEFHGNFNSGDLTGQGTRVNFESTDNSTNTVAGGSQLFPEIEDALKGVKDDERRAELIALVHEMKAAEGKATFSAIYQKFVAAAADHITLLAPFIPALTALLASGGY
jgi:hypothetical protein